MHPVLFTIGSGPHAFALHTYGVLLMVAFLAGTARACYRAKKVPEVVSPITPDMVTDAAIWIVLSAIVGARLLFVLFDWSDYKLNPGTVLAVWQGGMSFHGGLLGGIIAGVTYCRIKQVRIPIMADLLAPSVMLGYAIGRIGCFFNGCCYGGPTNLPWACRFNDNGIITPPSHPTQLYSSLLSFLFFGLLVRFEAGKDGFPGRVACWYLILAAVERFVMEIWRAGVTSSGGFLGLTEVQWLCCGMMALGVAGLIGLRSMSRNPGTRGSEAKAAG